MKWDSVVVSNTATGLSMSDHVTIVMVTGAWVGMGIRMMMEVVMRVVTQTQSLAGKQVGASMVDHVVVVGQNATSVQAKSVLDIVASVA